MRQHRHESRSGLPRFRRPFVSESRTMQRLSLAPLAAAGLLWMTLGMAAPARASVPDADCLACHSERSMKAQSPGDPRLLHLGPVGREKLTLEVTHESLAGSVHEGLACTDCHQGITEVPHAEKLPLVDCGGCHGDQAQAVNEGIHAAKKGGTHYTPQCWNCHGAHQIRPKTDPNSSIYPMNVPGTCGACHGDAKLMAAAGVVIANPLKNYMKSDHWRLLSSGKRLEAATCADCHGAHKILPSTNPKSPIYKLNVPKTCGKCHSGIEAKYARSVHGKALEKGNLEAPSCTNCHGEHDIEGPKRPTSSVYPPTVAETTCPQCHASVRLSERFNLPTGMVQSYKASFHGLAASYGQTDVANCASCHGAHDILPASDPSSSVNPANLQKTCGKCHPGATKAFARINIHSKVPESSSSVLFWIRSLYLWLIALVVGGLALHQLMDYVRRYRLAIQALDPAAVYRRMTGAERLQHFLLLSSFFTLVATGFALKYPDSLWSIPFKWASLGFDIRGWLHRAAAVVLIGDALYHLVYVISTKRGRAFIRDITPAASDVREFFQQIAYYLGLRRREADFGRFSYAEKLEYLALVWGTVVMVATGFVLWFKEFFTAYLPEWGYNAAEMIHFYEAVLAFATILIWHLYMVFVHTDHPPFNPTWITGLMTRKTLEHHHPRVLTQIKAEKAQAEKEQTEKAQEEKAQEEKKAPESKA